MVFTPPEWAPRLPIDPPDSISLYELMAADATPRISVARGCLRSLTTYSGLGSRAQRARERNPALKAPDWMRHTRQLCHRKDSLSSLSRVRAVLFRETISRSGPNPVARDPGLQRVLLIPNRVLNSTHTSQQIRLLSLHEDAAGRISCSVSVFDLSRCPRFIALSYVWGPPAAQDEITLNGHAFSIRRNLYSALKSISNHIRTTAGERESAGISELDRFQRSPGCWQYFWIDAICIQQEDVNERNHQVRMMGHIYERAAFVLAWLGLGCEGALRLLATADAAQLRSVYKPYTYSFQRSEFSEALVPFLDSDYWTRMWVVQEFVLARDVVFASGSALVPWERASKVFPEVYGYHSVSGYGCGPTLVNERRQQMFRQKQGFHPDLHELVRRFGLMECSDPRDKIFALAGLLGPSSDKVLVVDYSLTRAQLSLRTLKLASKSVKVRGQLEEVHDWFNRVLGINDDDSDGVYDEVEEVLDAAVDEDNINLHDYGISASAS